MPKNSRVKFGFIFEGSDGERILDKNVQMAALEKLIANEWENPDVKVGRKSVHVRGYWSNPEDRALRSRLVKTTDDPNQDMASFGDSMSGLIGSLVEPAVEAWAREKKQKKRHSR